MTYSMASIIKKTIRGKVYYYARECRRVAGKPKIVWQKYLGKADDIIAALGQPSHPPSALPQSAVVTEFGAVAALFDVARRLRLVEHIERHVAARAVFIDLAIRERRTYRKGFGSCQESTE